MNTSYGDYVIAQMEEVMELYEVDGWFVDIVRYLGGPCICPTCLAQMRAAGVNPLDPQQLQAFALAAERRFLDKCSGAVRRHKPDATIFYNARLRADCDPEVGNRAEAGNFSHLEIESLPGGFWGYDHFPFSARFFQTYDMDLLAMTGRFHTFWGDFGGLRNRAALEYECFLAQAHGAACSIGDQLHPHGRLDPVVYGRIGEVYAEIQRREPWAAGTQPLPEIGVLLANRGKNTHEGEFNDSDLGALHVLEQCQYQFQFLDAGCDFTRYQLIILPDEVQVDADTLERLASYAAGGGRVLITGQSLLNGQAGDFDLAGLMNVCYAGEAPFAPVYLDLDSRIAQGIEPMRHVCEERGVRVTTAEGATVLARAGVPYFNRAWERFCSHQYAPMERVTDDPLIVENAAGSIIYIALPLFREYALNARRVHRQVLDACIRRLLPRPRIGANELPTTAVVTARAQGRDLTLHLLNYLPQRRGKRLDVVEDVIPLRNVAMSVRCERCPTQVNLVPEREPLAWTYDAGYVRFTVPEIRGYQMAQVVEALP
jgi:hypothetical protein